MIKDNNILIKNIYYMLSYAFNVLKNTTYDRIASEDFDNIEDLFAAILSLGISSQIKRGLHKEYKVKDEVFPYMKGKINISNTIKEQLKLKKLLACAYDNLSENNILNQILKTTAYYLIKNKNVSSEHKKGLKRVLLYLNDIDILEISDIKWKNIRYTKNSKTYEMLLNICYFVLNRTIQTTEKGDYKMMGFMDDNMPKLYEKFILEYYKYHYPELHPKSSKIKWNLDDKDDNLIKFLPEMKSDITLCNNDRYLIIDAKYYYHPMQSQFNKNTIHSENLYQIYTYVKNMDKDGSGKVSGMLLYAKTDEVIAPEAKFNLDGNIIMVKTLDLYCDFVTIKKQLDFIVNYEFS